MIMAWRGRADDPDAAHVAIPPLLKNYYYFFSVGGWDDAPGHFFIYFFGDNPSQRPTYPPPTFAQDFPYKSGKLFVPI